MDRNEAYELLRQYTKREGLIKHALAVEAAMKEYAKRFGEDEESYRIVGLLHDFDYERYPTEKEHPFKGVEILRKMSVPEEWIDAILGHAEYSGVKRENNISKTLYAVDELTGFIVAVALVHPRKKLEEVSVKSVKKKLKDKAFASGVDRKGIERGAEELGIPLDEHIAFVIEAMKKVSNSLGL